MLALLLLLPLFRPPPSSPSCLFMTSALNPLHHGTRRLFELLEEQQEPEMKPQNATIFLCWPAGSSACRKLRRRFSSHGFKRRRGSRFIKSLLDKLMRKGKNNPVTFQRLSYSKEEQWRDLSSSNQLSPISVLDPHSHQVEEESSPSSSDSARLLLAKEAPWVDFEELIFSNSHDPEKVNSSKEEMLCSWENNDQDDDLEVIISQLVDIDLAKSRKEWSHFENDKRGVGSEIEYIIFEEIRRETVLDLLTLGKC
ncbi:hypothetical protein Cni_G16577 [Canna indica]|uniref:DUF4378 domain-containing protein n=1 Tax=Canna indica TaxID=4628 RepID=A0AAQ3QG01_9LILI|nr:hypothetical protein Cni_G16577 [Canna indica]